MSRMFELPPGMVRPVATTERISVSADGRFVAFRSNATNLAPGATGRSAIFLRDRLRGTTRLVSVNTAGDPANNQSLDPAISADGHHVAFASIATNLASDDNNFVADVFVRNLRPLVLMAGFHQLPPVGVQACEKGAAACLALDYPFVM